MNPLRILILSDDPLARAGLSTLLAAQDAVEVVASQESNADLIDAIATYRPDAIVWDLGWDLADSLEGLLRYAGQNDGQNEDAQTDEFDNFSTGALVPILALIAEPEQSRAIAGGSVQGLMVRDVAADALVSGLRAMVAGLLVFSPEFEPHSLQDESTFAEELIEPLTPREIEILQLIAEGLANKAIARQLGISDHTVKFHTTSLYGKLGVSSRTEAVVRATRLGLILL